MLPFQSEMQQNRWRLGLRPRPRWGSLHIPLMKSMTHYSESLHQMLPFMCKMHQNRWRLGLRPRRRWGNLHAIDKIHDTLLRIIAPDASIYVQNAPKSLAAGAPPPDAAGGTYMPLIKSMTHYSESLHQMLPFMSNMHQNRWRLGLRPRRRWGNLHAIDEIHDTLLRIIAPDASIYVQNAP